MILMILVVISDVNVRSNNDAKNPLPTPNHASLVGLSVCGPHGVLKLA